MGLLAGVAWALSHASLGRLLGWASAPNDQLDQVGRQRPVAFHDHVQVALVSRSPLAVERRDEPRQLAEASISIALRARRREVNAVEPLLDGIVLVLFK